MKKKMLSAALLLAALLCLCAAATADSTSPNAWINSDIRKYLNNGVTGNEANSTTGTHNSTNNSGYAAHFTEAEYALMQPTEVKTLKDAVSKPDETTDRIFLPSGITSFEKRMNVLSWGSNDVAGMKESDRAVLIPLGYWATGDNGEIWLRSAGMADDQAMFYKRGTGGGVKPDDINTSKHVAPAFTLDTTSILFASAASAAALAGQTPEGTRIEKWDYLGSTDSGYNTPSYGMYLKTAYTGKDFQVKNLSCSVDQLSFEYAGGMPGDYVMIQAYARDRFDDEAHGYVAAMPIPIDEPDGRGEMSVKMGERLMSNLADYTFKIWMENPSRVNLAHATEPQTFSFKNSSFVEAKTNQEIEELPKNLRMFSRKNELTCSWGDLSNSDNVVAGKTNSSGHNNDQWIRGKSCGVNPSNQIIYFGVESYSVPDRGVVSKPLRFWIAGHGEDSESDEDRLTLYQMSSNESHVFRGNVPYSPGNGLEFTEDSNQNGLEKGDSLKVKLPENQSYTIISTNPHVATVSQEGIVTIQNYGEFSIVLFNESSNQILQTQRISVVNSESPDYIRADEWPDDETGEGEQPEQSGQAAQDAAGGLPQTGDSSAALLWAALLALSIAGLTARRRRSA